MGIYFFIFENLPFEPYWDPFTENLGQIIPGLSFSLVQCQIVE